MEQNCFQAIQQYHLIEYKPKQQNQQIITITSSLEANPILPLGKYLSLNQSVNFIRKGSRQERVKNQKNKRISILPPIGHAKNSKPSEQSYNYNVSIPKQINPVETISKNHEFHQYFCHHTLVYRRIDNSALNYIGKNTSRYCCSIFVDLKQFINKRRVIDFYETIRQKYALNAAENWDQNLVFNSNFESGNLLTAYKKSDREYDLLMQNDINKKGCTQWFYFSISNKKKTKIRINIINFYKDSRLYLKGMKPVIFSKQRHRLLQQQWKRGGQAVCYEFIQISQTQGFYKLSFTYEFDYIEDTVYFAYSYPYTYSDLKCYLDRLSGGSTYKKILKRQVLCKSLLNKDLNILSVTENINQRNDQSDKPIIYVIARQHPGETPGSFIMEGFLNELLSNRIEAIQLRRKFIFKIVPMVNVDGVIVGNYRSNLSGCDVNRKWDFPNKTQQPEIWSIKQKILQDRKRIIFFLDLHGHSKKMNSFFYGNSNQGDDIRLYPFLTSNLTKSISKQESSYCNDISKKSTARLIVQNEMLVRKSYTFEVSFYGSQIKNKRQHFNKSDYRELGCYLLLGLFYTEIKFAQKQKDVQSIAKVDSLNKLNLIISPNSNNAGNKDKLKNETNQKQKSLEHAQQTIKEDSSKYSHLTAIENFTNITYISWLKQIERKNHQTNHPESESSGSDSDPQLFELTVQELQQISLMNDEIKPKHLNQNRSQQIYQKEFKQISSSVGLQTIQTTRSLKKQQFELPKSLIRQQKEYLNRSNRSRSPDTKNRRYYPSNIEYPNQNNVKDQFIIKNIQHRINSYNIKNRAQHPFKELTDSTDITIPKSRNMNSDIFELKRTLKYLIDRKQRTEIKNCLQSIEVKQKSIHVPISLYICPESPTRNRSKQK